MEVKDIIILILVVVILAASTWFIISSIMLRNKLRLLTTQLEKMKEETDKLRVDNEFKAVEYSKSTLEFIRDFCIQISVYKFKDFMDGHKIEMVTEMILKGLIKEICEFININLNYDVIIYGYSLYTKSYIENYIIETVVVTIKELFDKASIEIGE